MWPNSLSSSRNSLPNNSCSYFGKYRRAFRKACLYSPAERLGLRFGACGTLDDLNCSEGKGSSGIFCGNSLLKIYTTSPYITVLNVS